MLIGFIFWYRGLAQGGIAAVGQLKSLHFYMLGEPLLNRNAPHMIEDATNRGLAEKTILTTNGASNKESAWFKAR